MTQSVLLGDIVKIIKGISYRSSDYTVKGDGLAFINLKNVERSGGFRNDGVKYYKGDFKSNQIVIPGDILIANTDLTQNNEVIGSPIFMPDINELACFSLDLSKLEILNPSIIDKNYLFYYLKSPVARNYMVSHSNGSTVKHLSVSSIPKMTIKLPDLEIQKKISDILSSLDEKIELNRKMNETLEQIGQALFRHYFIDNPEAKKWQVGKIGEIISSIESGSRPKGGAISNGIPSIGAENIDGLGRYDYSKEKYVSREYFEKLNRGHVKSEDVALYKDGAYVGKKSLFMDDFPHSECVINEHIFILRTNDRLSSQFYLYFWLDQPAITDKIISAGVKAAQPGINQSNVRGLPILIPSTEAVRQFDNDIRPIMKQIFLNSKQNRELAILRDTLLPRLISGNIEL